MKVSDLYPIARAELERRAATDPQLAAVIRKRKAGTATFADTALYNNRLSDMLGETLAKYLPDLVDPGAKETVCEQLLRDEYENMNQLLAAVQKEMDSKLGISVAPQRAPFPSERVRQIAHSLEDLTVPESVIERRARKAVPTVSKSFHDDYIKTNSKLRNDLGLKPILQRYGSGCCEWCAAVAGKWRFGEQPDDVFRRHDNCDCVIIYDTQVLRGAKTEDGGRSKTWEEVDPSDVAADPPKKLTPEEAEKLQNSILQQLTLAGKRDIMESDGVVEDKKIVGFFLNPESKHGNEFLGVGYSADKPDVLKRDLLEALRTAERNPVGETEFGERFSIDAMLGVTERQNFQLIWQIDKSTGIPRIITGHRRKRGRK